MIQDVSADFSVVFQLVDNSWSIVTPDAAPTFRLYDPATGQIGSGTSSTFLTGTITGVSLANPAVITDPSHGLTGKVVLTISGVVGPTAVNGTATGTVTGVNTFTVPVNTSAASAYVSGGTWTATGLYTITFDSSLRSLMEPGTSYVVLIDYEVSTIHKSLVLTIEAS